MTFRGVLIGLVLAITIFDVLAVWIFYRIDRRRDQASRIDAFTHASRDQARRQALAELAQRVHQRP
jgi:uncharacterized membrane protein